MEEHSNMPGHSPDAPQSVPNATVFVNGQAAQAITPIPAKKIPKGRDFFIFLGVFQVLGVAGFFSTMTVLAIESKAGQSGLEFLALPLFIIMIPAIVIVAGVNLIGLPFYIRYQKPRGRNLALFVLSFLISCTLFFGGAYFTYQQYTSVNHIIDESNRKSAQSDREYAIANADSEITKEQAIDLLQTCKLRDFYYTAQTVKNDPSRGGWGELSSTGVVLMKLGGKPDAISIADQLIPELVPIARDAQRKCYGPGFWHDGSREELKDDVWYFKGQVVNGSEHILTRENAISYMQSCQVDYFVGQTDHTDGSGETNSESTKEWLAKAQKSSTGIAFLESSPKTYIFTSRAMTADLQAVARQFRQSCHDSRKLYITIDDSVETEYPAGTWVRVKQ